MPLNRPKATVTTTPALPRADACSTSGPMPWAPMASAKAITPNTATPHCESRSACFWSVMPSTGTTTLCAAMPPVTSRMVLTVDRMAEVMAPANTT